MKISAESSCCERCRREGVVFFTVDGRLCGSCAPRDIHGTIKIASRAV